MKQFMLSYLFLLTSTAIIAQDFIDAQPVGGKHQMQYFIEQELIYPEQMYEKGIEGTVSLRFDLDEKGNVISIKEVTSPDSAATAEAIRIFKKIIWTNATKSGFPVPTSKLFDIDFNIKKYNKLCKSRGYKAIVNPYEPIDSTGKIFWYSHLDAAPYPIYKEPNQNLAGFIAANLVYPELALRQSVMGVVKLSFIVETNGKISNMTIENSVGAGCNEEAIRILRLLKWMPGISNQKAVRTKMSLSINFNLDRGRDGMFNPAIKSSYGG